MILSFVDEYTLWSLNFLQLLLLELFVCLFEMPEILFTYSIKELYKRAWVKVYLMWDSSTPLSGGEARQVHILPKHQDGAKQIQIVLDYRVS